MKKRNKRGDTSPMGAIVAVIIVVVVGALVIWGFYKYWKPISDIPGLTLSEKQTITSVCDISGKVGEQLKTAYCYQFYKASDKYGNCDYWKDYVDFKALTGGCSDSGKVQLAAVDFCNQEKLTSQKVNNKACSDWKKEAESIVYEWVGTEADCLPVNGEIRIVQNSNCDTNQKSIGDNICCKFVS